VLGSGSPIADDARSGSGYLVWREGRALVLIDAGGGIFLRFGQSGARLEDLELIALTHFHTDHAADLPASLKGAHFSARVRTARTALERDDLRIEAACVEHGSVPLLAGTHRRFSDRVQRGSERAQSALPRVDSWRRRPGDAPRRARTRGSGRACLAHHARCDSERIFA